MVVKACTTTRPMTPSRPHVPDEARLGAARPPNIVQT
jgi:hypothetical protein